MPTLLQRVGLYGVLAADYASIQLRRLWKADIAEHGYWLDASGLGHYFDDALAAELALTLAGKSVIDFGCGRGKYVAYLTKAGIECRGYDGNPTTPEVAPNCFVADLAKRQEFPPADWVMSLEVGEHIPAEFEAAFLDNLTRHAREGLILSWALPSQPGRGHVNCLSNDAVKQKVAALGFTADEELERRLRRAAWLPWFRYTVMAFRRNAA